MNYPPPAPQPPPYQSPPAPAPGYQYSPTDHQQLMADLYAKKLGKGYGRDDEERIIGSITSAKSKSPTKFWNILITQGRFLFINTLAPQKPKKVQKSGESANDAPTKDTMKLLQTLTPEELLKSSAENFELSYQQIQAVDVREVFGGAQLRIQKGREKLKFNFSKDQYSQVCKIVDLLFPNTA